ncbi:two-component system, OmpR family, phosphate regulon sensor histidine kinase PhoR [Ectothiorhodospira magna]|uniref:Phosphate regulon sensor protein PhoR n=1 Tax=Ectothiorhodospira magna TaxID=867345 RepID=A0A1H8Z070_9GAMM|nr:phosphate regulon sensor histidine kinase PhoR [Ectothiorhodospira magna]SEP57845.1 two-component system, OmpR family, phosphate regulon sensor histidine kinase PhoR [Ectothiorhodospira magna]
MLLDSRSGSPWKVEFWRLSGFILAGLVLGALFGHLAWMLVLALSAYTGWQLRQLYRFHRWIQVGKRSEPPHASGVWGDLIYEQYRLYQRNRRRKKKIAKLLNRFHESSAAMPDATVILGSRFDIEWFNGAAISLLELESPRDIGRRVTNLLRHPEFVRYMYSGDYSDAVEFPRGPDERVMLSARIVPYGDKQFLLSVRDVTRLHMLESMRRDFVANVSHELRTPLTVIAGYLEALADEDTLEPEIRRSLRSMESQSVRMRRIIEDLLTLSRLETRDTAAMGQSPVSVPALIHGIEEEARMLIGERGQHLTLALDEGLWLRGANTELHSAFSNLVTNAIHYTPDGGTITVHWHEDDQGAHFQVRDTGIGIPPQHVHRLTERFYRVDSDRSRNSGGTGLGLAIVKHVLQRHGARLQIESTPGEGSTFSCHFGPDRIVRRGSEAARAEGAKEVSYESM